MHRFASTEILIGNNFLIKNLKYVGSLEVYRKKKLLVTYMKLYVLLLLLVDQLV